jgi:ferredoxin-NADP reductase
LAVVEALRAETPTVRTIAFRVPEWPGHLAGQHVDVRLTAPDGYEAQRSYSIASPPEDGDRIQLTVERLPDGEVSEFLVDEVRVGDRIELRGPIGGYFVWDGEADVIYGDELERLAAASPSLEVVHTLTRSSPPGWSGFTRRIDASMLRDIAWPPNRYPLMFVCGPTALVESVAATLVEQGHDPVRVRTERFGPTGG